MNMTDAQIMVLMVVIMVATSLQAALREADEVAEMIPEDRDDGHGDRGLGPGDKCSIM